MVQALELYGGIAQARDFFALRCDERNAAINMVSPAGKHCEACARFFYAFCFGKISPALTTVSAARI